MLMMVSAKGKHSRTSVALLLLFLSGATVLTWAQEEDAPPHSFLRQTIDDGNKIHEGDHDSKPKPKPKPKPDEGFSLEEGCNCEGGIFEKKGYFQKCQGGLKFGGFKKEEESSTTTDISSIKTIDEEARIIASGLHKHMSKGDYFLNVKDFVPSQDDIEQFEGMEVDGTSTEFGGFFGIGWGCKVKFMKKGNTLGETAECGAKGMKGMGLKSMTDYKDERVVAVNEFVQSMGALVGDHDFYVDDKPKPDDSFWIIKGINCDGAVIDKKGGGAKCEGGAKFKIKNKSELTDELAHALYNHMHEGYLPSVEDLMPSDDVLQLIQQKEKDLLISDASLQDLDDGGCEVEFGGFTKLDWGCKVSQSKGQKKAVAVCGMKVIKAKGVKPQDYDDYTANIPKSYTTAVY